MKKILTLIIFTVLLITPAYATNWEKWNDYFYINKDNVLYNVAHKKVFFQVFTPALPGDTLGGEEFGGFLQEYIIDCKDNSITLVSSTPYDKQYKPFGEKVVSKLKMENTHPNSPLGIMKKNSCRIMDIIEQEGFKY